MKLVVDTNVIISALVRGGLTRDFIIENFNHDLITPAYIFKEISKYKEYICKKANINSEQFYLLLCLLFRHIEIINPSYYLNYLDEAKELIGNIDKNDVPFLACALAFDCLVWSDDKHFKQQDKIKIYTTEDMIGFLEED